MLLRSTLLEGVRHGFSLREGGVSQGAFASLNTSFSVGDDPRAVTENLRRLQEAAGASTIVTATQVHGDAVLGARDSGVAQVFGPTEPTSDGADALLALEPGVAVAVRVADCVPILIYDAEHRVGAAVHSGWRGTRLGIAARAVRAMQHAAGSEPAKLVAAIGPSIDVCCYEVSADLAASFAERFGSDVVQGRRLNLRRAVAKTLAAAGVHPDRIERVGGCTSCDASAFFSHRRDQGRTGRHLAFIRP